MKKITYILFLVLSMVLYSCSEGDQLEVEPEVPENPQQPDAPNENGDEEGNNTSPTGRSLIAYYSWSGNSRGFAQILHNLTGAEIVEVTMTNPYSATTDQQLYSIATAELNRIDRDGVYPAINTVIESLEAYDTVFLLTPLWHARMSTPMQSFLYSHAEKLAGKRLALIITSASSGVSQVMADARRLCPNSILTNELWINYAAMNGDITALITNWLLGIGVSP